MVRYPSSGGHKVSGCNIGKQGALGLRGENRGTACAKAGCAIKLHKENRPVLWRRGTPPSGADCSGPTMHDTERR